MTSFAWPSTGSFSWPYARPARGGGRAGALPPWPGARIERLADSRHRLKANPDECLLPPCRARPARARAAGARFCGQPVFLVRPARLSRAVRQAAGGLCRPRSGGRAVDARAGRRPQLADRPAAGPAGARHQPADRRRRRRARAGLPGAGVRAAFHGGQDKWYRARGSAGAPAAETGLRRFLVQDPDGYLARFAHPLGVRRMPA